MVVYVGAPVLGRAHGPVWVTICPPLRGETEAREAREDQRVGQAQPQPPARAQAAHQDRLEPHVDILDLTVWTSYYVDILLCGHLTM